MNIQDIIKANPVLSDPNLTDKLKRWERIRDAVETAYPESTPENQAQIIGEVIEHLEAGAPQAVQVHKNFPVLLLAAYGGGV
jgi:hypothetical protein